MAGLAVAAAPVVHRSRGVVRNEVLLTCDAAGVVSESVIGVGYGRLVGLLSKGPNAPLITVKDGKTGQTLLTHRPNVAVFGNTTTGDTTGGTSEDLWTTGAAHGLVAGDVIVFTSLTGGGTVAINTPYWVTATTGFAATTFCLSSTAALSAATTCDVEIGATDVSASTWYKTGATVTASFVRPTDVITDVAGTDVTAATTAPNVNRDIIVAGKVSVSAAGGSGATACTLALIVDEAYLCDGPALTV